MFCRKTTYYIANLILLLGLLVTQTAATPITSQTAKSITSKDSPNLACSASIIVMNNNDNGSGSLRQATLDICSGGTITFDALLAGQTITLQSVIGIEKSLTIDATALNSHITIDGNNYSGFLSIPKFIDIYVTLKGLDIQNCGSTAITQWSSHLLIKDSSFLNNNTVSNWGGAIYNDGDLNITNSVFLGNNAIYGGAIYNSGELTIDKVIFSNNGSSNDGGGIYNSNTLHIVNSIFSNNQANFFGGAIYTRNGRTGANASINESTFSGNSNTAIYYEGAESDSATEKLTITNSTISGNTGAGIVDYEGHLSINNSTITNNTGSGIYGAGLFGYSTTSSSPNALITITNSILANNINGADCYINKVYVAINSGNLIENNGSGVNSCGTPLLTSDPKLGPLQDNGGVTFTHALLPDSPAIDAGNNAFCPSKDQLGTPRPIGEKCDIGSFEAPDIVSPTILSITRASSNPSSSTRVSFIVTFSEAVTNLDTILPSDDFELTTTGVSGAAIINISYSGEKSIVTVNTGTGDGSIHLDLIDNDTISDLASNPLGGAGNSNFITGETYTIDKLDLAAPILRSPQSNLVTKDSAPIFSWKSVNQAVSYEIQFASDNSFTTNLQDNMTGNTSSFTSPAFTDGIYYWRVRARNASNQPGAWSAVRIFIIDTTTTGPAAPILSSPTDITSTNHTPTFKWLPSSTAIAYEFQYDNDSDFSSPIRTITTRGTSRKPPTMRFGVYYWHVRAKDAAGNWGDWSTTFTINITR